MAMDVGTRLQKEAQIAQDAIENVASKLLDMGLDPNDGILADCYDISDAIKELRTAIRKETSSGGFGVIFKK